MRLDFKYDFFSFPQSLLIILLRVTVIRLENMPERIRRGKGAMRANPYADPIKS